MRTDKSIEANRWQQTITNETENRRVRRRRQRMADVTKKEVTREKKRKRKRSERIRLIPIWLRLIIVIVLCCLSLIGGLMFGFGVVGDGAPLDVLKPETWTHILNNMNGVE